MNAMYFLERLQNYKNEKEISKMAYDGYEGHSVTIHRKNASLMYYDIFINGSVHRVMNRDIQILSIEDLEGDDFELFNTRQIVGYGHITGPVDWSGAPEKYELKYLSNLNNLKIAEQIRYDILLYIWNKQHETNNAKFTIPFCNYQPVFKLMDIEVYLLTDDELERFNEIRKYYGASIIPFDNNCNRYKLNFIFINDIKFHTNIEFSKLIEEFLNLLNNACRIDDFKFFKKFLERPIYL